MKAVPGELQERCLLTWPSRNKAGPWKTDRGRAFLVGGKASKGTKERGCRWSREARVQGA